ncbi:glycosyltransferase family 2 protein [Patescibacteria group bacterium]|nr:glycosyltransferase family 2 protein [Patescibacteria group bacterium]MCL5091439.1 glycosyltransferase family 2 protein [Patescibacteria group bacterium]
MEKAISVLTFSRNEEKNITKCIESAKLLSSTVIVVDMESQDRTVALAKSQGATVYPFPNAAYVEPARNFGVAQANTEWIFILDADERITPELADEIKRKITTSQFSYYYVPRKNIFAGKKWLKHGGWWPDRQPRLIKRNCLVTWPKAIHSSPIIRGDAGQLNQPLLHYFHGQLLNMVEKTATFEDIESNLLLRARKQVGVLTFFRKFWGELLRRLIIKFGFLDGSIGVLESVYQAFSKTFTYLFLYEKTNRRTL